VEPASQVSAAVTFHGENTTTSRIVIAAAAALTPMPTRTIRSEAGPRPADSR
jgi:hypothetical protein